MRFAAHICRMDPSSFTFRIFNYILFGTRTRGMPKLRWADCVKADFSFKCYYLENCRKAEISMEEEGSIASIEKVLNHFMESIDQWMHFDSFGISKNTDYPELRHCCLSLLSVVLEVTDITITHPIISKNESVMTAALTNDQILLSGDNVVLEVTDITITHQIISNNETSVMTAALTNDRILSGDDSWLLNTLQCHSSAIRASNVQGGISSKYQAIFRYVYPSSFNPFACVLLHEDELQ
ncbi:hypothetical protein CEXT_759361 [Caerostris extrusa]|uniref:Uncharacterized protein n=1 Tax=Caerostris extrusa TaxID=172846 RepID=A0AAV4NXN8_CAEEX|nr:hypothetical protein CEXT_759361 [Caerostris extrusa]